MTHDCEVWPEHWPMLQVFLLCQDQWRVVGDAIIGIDLSVAMQVADAYDVGSKRQFLEDLQVVARHAANLINKERGRG